MFCPRCGQPSPDDIRFCPKCGLALAPHAALLTVGYTPAADLGAAAAPARTKKQVATRRAAKLMFFSVVLTPIFIGLSVAAEGGEPLLVPFFAFLAGLAWLVYARLFVDDIPRDVHHTSRRDLSAGADRAALGAAQFVPASSFNRQPANTAEIAPPPSVTENSTRLLDKDA